MKGDIVPYCDSTILDYQVCDLYDCTFFIEFKFYSKQMYTIHVHMSVLFFCGKLNTPQCVTINFSVLLHILLCIDGIFRACLYTSFLLENKF